MPTQGNEGLKYLIEDVKGRLAEILHEGMGRSRTMIQHYWDISQMADRLLIETLGPDGMKLPVNIMELAGELGLLIVEEDLNEFPFTGFPNRKIGQIVIYRDIFSDTVKNIIYTDRAAAFSARRYAIAHEIVHFIMHYEDTVDYYEDYCIMPLCPVDMEEIIADIFAIFLLVPVPSFFREFQSYVDRQITEEKNPVTTEDWLKYLAERSLLSEYYVAYGYQQLRYVAYWIHQAWYREKENEMMSMDEKEREDIIEATESYFGEDVAELLFQ